MKELSLHILDVVENSTRAGATTIKIDITEAIKHNQLRIQIRDNGKGIDPSMVDSVTDPFVTTRTERRAGMGLPLLKAAAIRCNGHFNIDSTPGKGTQVEAIFQYDHIDRAPLGDMPLTMITLLAASPDTDFDYTHTVNQETFYFNTAEIREELEGIELNHPEVLNHLRQAIRQGLTDIMNHND